jgi:two-component system chemotaxis response regulator CheY
VCTGQNVPDIHGLSLIKALLTMKNCQKVPIVMLTTESGDEMEALSKVVRPING